MAMLIQILLLRCLHHQAICTASYHLIRSHSLTSQPSSIPSEQGGQQLTDLSSLLLLLLLMLTLTPHTYPLPLLILGSLRCTQHNKPPHLPPTLLLLSPLPLPLEHPSSMADQELHHHLQLMHCLLEQQVHRLLPVSCLHPREQVCAWKGFAWASGFRAHGWMEGIISKGL